MFFKFRVTRNYILSQLLGVVFGALYCLFSIIWFLPRIDYLGISLILLLAYLTVFKGARALYRIGTCGIDALSEVNLAINKDGIVAQSLDLGTEVKACGVWFEADRNYVVGEITLSDSSGKSVTEVLKTSSWRHFSRGSNLAPVWLRAQTSDWRFAKLDFKIRIIGFQKESRWNKGCSKVSIGVIHKQA